MQLVRRFRRVALLGTALIVGCDGEVTRVDDASTSAGQGSAGATSSVASATSSSSSGDAATGPGPGGAGGEGAGGPSGPGGSGGAGGTGGAGEPTLCGDAPLNDEPIAGCAALAWTGEPVFVAASHMAMPHLAALDGGDVGLTYVEDGDGGDVISRRITSPFSVWPPTMGPPRVVLENNSTNWPPFFSSRRDGTFSTFTYGVGAIAKFGAEGTQRTYEDGLLYLDPAPNGGGYLVDAFGGTFRRLPSTDPTAEATLVFESARECQRLEGFVTPDADFLGVFGPVGYLADTPGCPSPSNVVELVRADAQGGEDLTPLVLGAETTRTVLIPRPGGAWLGALVREPYRACMIPLDASGAVAGPTWQNAIRQEIELAPSGAGFAYAQWSATGLQVTVSDGVGTSRTPAIPYTAPTHPIAVAASEDARSVVVAFERWDDEDGPALVLHRADCVAGE